MQESKKRKKPFPLSKLDRDIAERVESIARRVVESGRPSDEWLLAHVNDEDLRGLVLLSDDGNGMDVRQELASAVRHYRALESLKAELKSVLQLATIEKSQANFTKRAKAVAGKIKAAQKALDAAVAEGNALADQCFGPHLEARQRIDGALFQCKLADGRWAGKLAHLHASKHPEIPVVSPSLDPGWSKHMPVDLVSPAEVEAFVSEHSPVPKQRRASFVTHQGEGVHRKRLEVFDDPAPEEHAPVEAPVKPQVQQTVIVGGLSVAGVPATHVEPKQAPPPDVNWTTPPLGSFLGGGWIG